MRRSAQNWRVETTTLLLAYVATGCRVGTWMSSSQQRVSIQGGLRVCR